MTLKTKRILIAALAILLLIGGGWIAITGNSRADVVLDPGHGGHDVGAEWNGRYEKDDNLQLALAVAKQLKNRGVNVKLTRARDTYLTLEKRCRIANRNKAALFVSLHRNSADNASGVEIWIGSEDDAQSRTLATEILAALDAVGIAQNRGVKVGYITDPAKDYYVNANTNMPSCLVELGFVTSETDNALLDRNLEAYANAIAQAIAAHPALDETATVN